MRTLLLSNLATLRLKNILNAVANSRLSAMQWRISHSGGSLPCFCRVTANPAALLVPPAEILRFSARKIRNAAALLMLPAEQHGGNFRNSANFNEKRNLSLFHQFYSLTHHS